MNIAILPSSFYPNLGGVEELVRQFAHEMIRQEQAVEIHVNRWPKALARTELFERVLVRRYCFRVPEHTAKQMAGALLLGPRTLRDLCGNLRRQRAQVIHVQCVSSNAYYAIRARRRLGIPLVVTLQGELTMDANHLFERSKFARGLLRSALDEADVITACSIKTREDAEAFYGRSFGSRGRVIWNGANSSDFQHTSPFVHLRPYIFALGRLVPQKGFDLLIRAFAGCGGMSHDLIIAGEGPERAAVEQLSGELGLSGRVHFPGRADRGQVASYFAGSSFFVLPSRADEGLPVVCAEAMAAGRPIIAARAGGAPEAVIDGDSGILVDKEDVAALSGAIGMLCNNSELRRRLAAGASRRAELFSWSSIARQYISAYADAIEQRAASHSRPQRL